MNRTYFELNLKISSFQKINILYIKLESIFIQMSQKLH
jgi:hypothetical protein